MTILPKALLLAAALVAGNVSASEGEAMRLFIEKQAGIPGGRVEVSVGTPTVRPQLAPCAKVQPFIPSGARLWGRTTLGVRCVEGANWQYFLPVSIKVFAPAPVAARALAAGENVTEADIRYDEVELTRYAPGSMADPAKLGDRQLSRPLAAGEPLLAAWFRTRQVIAQGDAVKVVYSGAGFSVSAEGKALANAGDGQSVRVATESGRVVTGTARQGRLVELSN